ncbi:MAG: hypothetical protein J6X03_04185 [Bacilli bacterium]|nr:hypothetical protein [Bacilli bacterium]
MLKKCIGIVSYFPSETARFNARAQRIARFNNLLGQINSLWPNIDILIVAQNWQDYQLPELTNKFTIYSYAQPLTIIGARNTLREKILNETDYEYIIMIDDDAVINSCGQEIADAYMKAIDENPDKFCFIHDKNHWHTCDDYIKAPLNLCAISRFIYEKEEFPQVCLEKNEALEDDLYAVLLHIKYAEYEFIPPTGIKCIHAVDGSQYLLQLMGRGFPST